MSRVSVVVTGVVQISVVVVVVAAAAVVVVVALVSWTKDNLHSVVVMAVGCVVVLCVLCCVAL